ncbi:MAG: hypothetical protein Q9219_003450 [cf. Caloplaca sp. 3 TL-2023]
MFRKPRDGASATKNLPSPKPPIGRSPTPPQGTTPEHTAEAVHAPVTNISTPLLGRSKTAPRTNGKTLSAGGKMAGRSSNGSILNFFKKASVISNLSETKEDEDSLFLDNADLDGDGDGDGPIQTPTPPRDQVAMEQFRCDSGGYSPVEESVRYNEVGGAVKRRRLSTDLGRDMLRETPQSITVERKGPFIDESEDEDGSPEFLPIHDDKDTYYSCTYQDCARSIPGNGFPHRWNLDDHLKRVHASPVEERPGVPDGGDTETIEETLTPSVPALKREPTSYIDGLDNDDLDDFIDAEYPEGEEYMERKWMEEQAELGVDLEDDDGPKDETDDGVYHNEQPELSAPSTEESSGSCPICGGNFGIMSEQDASKHVNDCLDGKAKPLSRSDQRPTVEKAAVVKTEIPSHKRFQRAAIAKPGQENPFSLASSGVGGSSAFSKLMSGHAEDAAWATAAATEAASRGKPAYQRTCPFYKILPGLYICVDAFRYGAVEGCKAYFLSHFHSDHYVGLTSSWCHGPIYCSRVTGNLVRKQLRVDPKWVVDLEFDKKVEVPGTQGVHVTMIPANHCPGSSLYLYEKIIGKGKNPKVQRVLHCGDFRACPAHVQHPLLRPDVIDTITGKNIGQQKLDVCYLDTTYLTPKYAFPSQEEVIKACADMCVSLSKDRIDENDDWEQTKKERAGSGMVKFIRKDSDAIQEESDEDGESKAFIKGKQAKRRGRLLVIVGTYSIGKERICLGVAKALNSKIYATPNKQKICAALEDPELMGRMTDDPLEAQVHMQMLMEIRAETLADYLTGYKPHFSRIVGFRPSGWNYRPPNSRFVESPAVQTVLHSDNWKSRYSMAELMPQRGSTRESQCFGVPYSEHSSFRELTMFCCALRIDKIIPTVNVGSAKSRERMKGWCEKWAMEKKKNGLFRVADDQTAWS